VTAPAIPHQDDIGEIVCSWTRNGVQVLAAPPIALASWDIIDSLERDWVNPRIVVLTDDVRYRIGGEYPLKPHLVLLHRVP
jgi:hypothetical protein